jgi:AraC family transcriptional regulator of adaptative response/methylated-DNA-[protein]-cysteine methyltransferase
VRTIDGDATVSSLTTKELAMNSITVHTRANVEELRFAFGTFSLGTVLIAVSREGVAAILMGDDRDALVGELTSAFAQTQLRADETALADMVAKIVTFLDAPHGGLALPLDMRGSALEHAVWQALRSVPAGRTATYGQIARTLPVPATAQEVGAACAANVLAVAVPCHRIIKADGAIAGYRWGVPRKRALIRREQHGAMRSESSSMTPPEAVTTEVPSLERPS